MNSPSGLSGSRQNADIGTQSDADMSDTEIPKQKRRASTSSEGSTLPTNAFADLLLEIREGLKGMRSSFKRMREVEYEELDFTPIEFSLERMITNLSQIITKKDDVRPPYKEDEDRRRQIRGGARKDNGGLRHRNADLVALPGQQGPPLRRDEAVKKQRTR